MLQGLGCSTGFQSRMQCQVRETVASAYPGEQLVSHLLPPSSETLSPNWILSPPNRPRLARLKKHRASCLYCGMHSAGKVQQASVIPGCTVSP